MLRDMGVPLLIHQPSYSLLNRWIEEDLLDVLEREGVGCIAFSPLAQGMLTDKYLGGRIPEGSRAAEALSVYDAIVERVEDVRECHGDQASTAVGLSPAKRTEVERFRTQAPFC